MKKFRSRLLLAAAAFSFFSGAAAEEAELRLKPSPALIPATGDETEETPLFIEAQRIEGHKEKEIEAHGDAVLRKRGQALFADDARYSLPDDTITATGHVRLEQGSDVIEGTHLQLQLETRRGFMESPVYRLLEDHAHGSADRLLFEGKGLYRAQRATYTTCEADNDWHLRVSELEIDRGRDVGVAKNASVLFKGVPVLYSPWMDFPLGDRRKSGFLTPGFGTTGKSGAELTVPYYWNIAPNRDATISPRFLAKRGLLLGTQFRYLEPAYNGEANVEVLPGDRVKGESRYHLKLAHGQSFGRGWAGTLDGEKVSDDTYFADLSDKLAVTSQANLPRNVLAYYGGGWWNFAFRIQRFQTLQDPLAPVTPPYHRLPQLALNAYRQNIRGADVAFTSEYVDFSHPTLVNGNRLTLYPTLSFPVQTAYAYVSPKVGLHLTRYRLDRQTTALPTEQTRSVPIFSVDGGLIFEREIFPPGTHLTQTLEPRLYYVYVPFREQNSLPNFDSGEADINMAQLFTENQFSGGDRINDANQLTFGVTSRLLDPDSGGERLNLSLAQRYHFKAQEVTLNPVPRTNTASDLLAAVSGRITPSWLVDAGLRYNPNRGSGEKITMGARYQPAAGRVLNLGYRYARETMKQVDVSAQWPLAGRWEGLARWNYSLLDRKVLEGLAGLEYNAGCWALRLVAHRFATATQDAVNSIFVQLELSGVSRIGANPLEILKQNISGYTTR